MLELHDSLREAGLPVSVQRLHSTESATSVRVRDGETEIVDGPFAVTKEVLAGYYILECSDLDEALKQAARLPMARWGTVEVRPMMPPRSGRIGAEAGRGVRRGDEKASVSGRRACPARSGSRHRDAPFARSARSLATLIRQVGDFQLAEDAVQDAFAAAVATWPRDGVPAEPGGVAHDGGPAAGDRPPAPHRVARRSRRAPGRAGAPGRREEHRGRRGSAGRRRPPAADLHVLPPGARMPARVALTLRALGGLTTGEIARAFLVAEPTMGKRIVRAKRKIADARIPYRVPGRRGAARPPARRAAGRVPDLQRGLRGHRGRPSGPRRAVRRGDPPRARSCAG